MTVENAKNFFERVKNGVHSRDGLSDSIVTFMSNAKLNWELADTVMYLDTIPLLFVPVSDHKVNRSQQVRMMFFNDSNGQIISTLFIMTASDDYTTYSDYYETFTGSVIQFNWDGDMINSLAFDQGYIIGPLYLESSDRSDVRHFQWVRLYPDGAGNFYMDVYTLDNGPNPWFTPNNYPPFGVGNTGGSGSGNNTNTSPNLQDIFHVDSYDLDILLELASNFSVEHDMEMKLEDILNLLNEECSIPDNNPMPTAEILLTSTPMPDCVKKVLYQDRIEQIKTMIGATVNTDQLLQFVPLGCIFSGSFKSCFENTDLYKVAKNNTLSPTQINYLVNNLSIFNQVKEYMNLALADFDKINRLHIELGTVSK